MARRSRTRHRRRTLRSDEVCSTSLNPSPNESTQSVGAWQVSVSRPSGPTTPRKFANRDDHRRPILATDLGKYKILVCTLAGRGTREGVAAGQSDRGHLLQAVAIFLRWTKSPDTTDERSR